MSGSSADSSLDDLSDSEETPPQNAGSRQGSGITGQAMPPLRTGRNTPLNDDYEPARTSSGNLTRRDPLPPIGQTTVVVDEAQDDAVDGDEEEEDEVNDDDEELPSGESSDELENVSEDLKEDYGAYGANDISRRRSSYAANVVASPAVREVTTRLNGDGREVEMISIDIQTEINMAATPDVVSSMKTEIKGRRFSRQGSARSEDEMQKDERRPGSKDESAVEDKTQTDETSSMPWPPRDDEFGVPLLELSSDSEVSDEEGNQGDFEPDLEHQAGAAYSDTLPSVGPPEILKYIRESERVDIEHPRASGVLGDSSDSSVGITGVCEFCKQPIKPFPTLEQQESLPPEELYCCEEYRNFVHFALNIPTADVLKQDYKIDIKPHAHYGSKQARRIAKERATMRLRERELMRQQQAVAAGMPSQQSAFYNFAKQMKTINFQLSSQKCQDEGWTVRPPTPEDPREPEPQAFEIEPMDWPMPEDEELQAIDPLAYDAMGRRIHVRNIIERYYDNKNKFLTVFPDGTGHVFYPSGNLAITISSVVRGQFRYVIQDDAPDKKAVVLAVFEPSGVGTCNYRKGGAPRLYFDQIGGVESDHDGARKKKWHWREKAHHVHAPPFQPICFSLNKYISVRVMTQENIAMQFMTKRRSCRFNVGVRLKLVNAKYLPIQEVDENKLFISEKMATIESMMNKIANMLRYPHSSKVTKIKPPLYLTSKVEKNEKMQVKRRRQKEEALEREKNANVKPIVLVT